MSGGFSLSVAVHTDVGRVRTNNEDSFGHAWLADGSLFVIVADGMGGHEAGEVASGLAVQVVEDVITQNSTDAPSALHDALLEANGAIVTEGEQSGKLGMGTTAIGAIFRGNQVYVGQVGDSRLYQFRKGHPVWRTLDHTRVQMLIDSGEISEEEARSHPEAGMLTRALGHTRMADGRPLEPEVLRDPLVLESADALVLCSDGLHDLVEDWEIGRVVAGKTADEAAAALVQLACDRGGHDNVTVAVIVAGQRSGPYDENFHVSYLLGINPVSSSQVTDEAAGPDWGVPPPQPAAAPPGAAGMTPGTTLMLEPPDQDAVQAYRAANQPPVEARPAGGKRGMLIGAAVVAVLLLVLLVLVVAAVVIVFATGMM